METNGLFSTKFFYFNPLGYFYILTLTKQRRNKVMKQQTAVEWLIDQIIRDSNTRLRGLDLDELVEQAKQMEKEQIMDAANTLLYRGTGPGDMWAEQYYNETYKK